MSQDKVYFYKQQHMWLYNLVGSREFSVYRLPIADQQIWMIVDLMIELSGESEFRSNVPR